MQVRPLTAAAIAAALATGGGILGNQMTPAPPPQAGPGAAGIRDQLTVQLLPGAPANPLVPDPTGSPVASPTADPAAFRDGGIFELWPRPAFAAEDVPPATRERERRARIQQDLLAKGWGVPVGSANVRFTRLDATGAVRDQREVHNIVLNVGKDAAIRRIMGEPFASPSTGFACPSPATTPCGQEAGCGTPRKAICVCIGTDNTAGTDPTQTSCRTAVGTPQQDTSADFLAAGQGTIIVTFAAGNPGTSQSVGESALYFAAADGTCPTPSSATALARTTLASPITKLTTESLQIQWIVSLG